MLFLRLANYLSRQNYQVAIVDYPDGDMANNNDEGLELISYDDDRAAQIPDNVILIFQSMTPWSIFPMLDIPPNTHVFFITTLPANFYPVLPGRFRTKMYEGGVIAKVLWQTFLLNEYLKSKKFLNLIERTRSHAILDANISCNLEKSLKVHLNSCQFLPLFSEDSRKNEFFESFEAPSDVIKLGWVGRLSDFKISILNRVVKDAFRFSNENKKKVEFYIVGDGEYASSLIDLSSNYFTIHRLSYIKPSELNKFMLSLGMLFAMGTSALDGAKLGVPTVRLDYSYLEIPKSYRYKFFYEIHGFSLGEKIGGSCFQNGFHTFDDLMVEWEANMSEMSRKTYEFYINNHSLSNSAKLFIDYLGRGDLTWGDLKNKKLQTSFIYSLWTKVKARNG
ncbi:hypothetical protein CYQ88_00860 [Hydrogenovibrio sp. SC-1]|nr:hypothetical protein CYQ88_00860 [Hydrogenovibrio sp. SC-1]